MPIVLQRGNRVYFNHTSRDPRLPLLRVRATILGRSKSGRRLWIRFTDLTGALRRIAAPIHTLSLYEVAA